MPSTTVYREAVILIHGITPSVTPSNPGDDILKFFKRIRSQSGVLQVRFPDACIFNLEWGHILVGDNNANIRSDQNLMTAENEVLRRVIGGPRAAVINQREIARMMQNSLLVPGIGDVIYFAGEGASSIQALIRDHIINVLPNKIQDFGAPGVVVRLHVIAASLGVSIAYDLLSNIFNQAPRFKPLADFNHLRKLASPSGQGPLGGKPKIELGTFVCAASQLPLLLLRRQEYVDLMANKDSISPRVIGFKSGHKQAWVLFHDDNDVLSFKTKPLFSPSDDLVEIVVENQRSDNIVNRFIDSHTGYWNNDKVISEARKVLEDVTDDHGV
jgi:hypothetical protein